MFKKKKEEATEVTCLGCDMIETDEKIKWILNCFKKFEIAIEWPDPMAYQQLVTMNDKTFVETEYKEKESQRGIPLESCFDLLVQEETLEDFQCDKCDKKVECSMNQTICRLPDFLIIHLKRFANYLEKIDDLVTFPTEGLDITKYLH